MISIAGSGRTRAHIPHIRMRSKPCGSDFAKQLCATARSQSQAPKPTIDSSTFTITNPPTSSDASSITSNWRLCLH
eukprot:scaffold47821_cov29-Tisochrysis_lutea.AAC.4